VDYRSYADSSVSIRFHGDPGLSISLEEYVEWLREAGPLESAVCFDNDRSIQREILCAFVPEKVAFFSHPHLGNGAPAPDAPNGRFLLEAGIESFDLDALEQKWPGFSKADVVLVRSSLAHFVAGKGDLSRLAGEMLRRGFQFAEVLDYHRLWKLDFLNSTLTSVTLVFEKTGGVTQRKRTEAEAEKQERARRRRLGEALTFLSPPIARAENFVRLTGRGSFGFGAGVFNPGAIAENGHIFLLARGENLPWDTQKKSWELFHNGMLALLLRLDENLGVSATWRVPYAADSGPGEYRVEDFRLFRHGGQLLASHTCCQPSARTPDAPVVLESLTFRIGLSSLDLTTPEMKFLGLAKIDRPMAPMEKNWVFFEAGGVLYMVYAFHPYHLFRLRKMESLEFETVLQRKLSLPIVSDGIRIRNSINPVEYDENHLLHVVHKVYPGKQYVFWAILIDKKSLLPVMISSAPLVQGWVSAPAAIIYACSAVALTKEVLLFAGLNDSGAGVWRIPRSDLDLQWTPIASNANT